MKVKQYLLLGCLTLAVWTCTLIALWPAHGVTLDWDEVDYDEAAKLGFIANGLEQGSMSPKQFAQFVDAKRSGRMPDAIPDYDESLDPLLRRHYHPPFVVYLISAMRQVTGEDSERIIRSVQLLGALALILALILSYRSITGPPQWTGGMLVVSLLALWISLISFSSLSFHGWAAVWTVTTAALLVKWSNDSKPVWGILLCLSLALSLLTLETGLVVWGAALLCVLIWRRTSTGTGQSVLSWRHIAVGLILSTCIVLLAWPGLVLKLSLLKTVALHVYRTGLGKEYGGTEQRLPLMIASLLPMLVLAPVACGWLFRAYRDKMRQWGPYVVIGLIYAITMAPMVITQYLVPAVAPLICVVGLAVDRLRPIWAQRLTAALAILLVLFAWPSWQGATYDRDVREDIRWSANNLRGKEALVDGGHLYSYYLGPDYAVRPLMVSYDGDALLVREGLSYRPLTHQDIVGKIVIIRGIRSQFFDGKCERDLLGECCQLGGLTVKVYDCSCLKSDQAATR